MKKLAAAMLAGLMMLSFQFIQSKNTHVNAETLDHVDIYTVQKGDSLFKIGLKYGVSELEIKEINYLKSKKIHPGQKLILPETISKAEKDLLARLVHAEAKGEPHEGKVAVALVVLNRVEDDRFPDKIKDVIYQKRQFQPVDNGSINEPSGEDSKKAMMEALALQGQGNESIFFFNPDKTNSKWLRTKTVTTVIGNHRFAK
ncbi:cell wall hydrolase [Bacillus sp. DTU_2020_1000418_1_SI_GHA_SEK_038]|uniref:cell wall hydrolase n=1 Tax=Bacillus sp. DTU_2020_1000418_1_SI_GHA_SEK_038 TaxID=3077585 RepID=UPI0028E47D1D|nr:cell wall hydrolase [Bacillus sp. DTU_2020_1000418_1_SI_GHA_SEK_038]WNS76933.1 cell wall hydrolase [Bacillus sp. DTU_2020_1000418_1_SI_GHA_SEK_038]